MAWHPPGVCIVPLPSLARLSENILHVNKNESVCQMVSQNIRYTIILAVFSASVEVQNSNTGYLQSSFN